MSNLPFHQLIKQTNLDEFLWDFDAVSLYLSAKWDENSSYPRIKTEYAFARDMNDEQIEKFNTGNFSKGIAILKKIL